jgi:hypothetical protein
VRSNTVAVTGQDDPGEETTGCNLNSPHILPRPGTRSNESSGLVSSAARLSPCAWPLLRRRKRQRPGQEAAVTAGAFKYNSWKHPPAWTASGGCAVLRSATAIERSKMDNTLFVKRVRPGAALSSSTVPGRFLGVIVLPALWGLTRREPDTAQEEGTNTA